MDICKSSLLKISQQLRKNQMFYKNKTSWKSEINLSSMPINDFQDGFKMNTNKRVVP